MNKCKIIFLLLVFCGLTACGANSVSTTHDGYKRYGEQLEDVKTANFIRNRFRGDSLIPDHINIAVDRGIVQLSGFVRTYEEANLAVLNARNTPGVKEVINNIIVLNSVEYSNIRANAEKYGKVPY